MLTELDPVGADEYVLRRIPAAAHDAEMVIPVQWIAFRPRLGEEDGLSVFREALISAEQLAAAGRSRGGYYVVRLSVGDLRRLNLSVNPLPVPDLPGHAVIPEISWSDYERDRTGTRFLLLELARLASNAVVFSPSDGSSP